MGAASTGGAGCAPPSSIPGSRLAALLVTLGLVAGAWPATTAPAGTIPAPVAIVTSETGSPTVEGAGFVAAAGGPRGATVTLSRVPEGYQVDASCTVRASRAVAWSVLTDYDGIDTFVPSMKRSRVMERHDDHLLVEQIAAARLFVFGRKMRVVLRVHEEPPDSIRFQDVAKQDFSHYHGAWSVESRGAETRLVYRVIAKPNFSVPDFVLRSALRNSIRSLLTDVGVEIERRAALVAR